MKYTNEEYRRFLQSFLKRWPVHSIKNISLVEFVGLHDRDTFCYWVERRTERLGSIKGTPSDKFGIYKRGNSDNLPDAKLFNSDNSYSWRNTYGKNRKQALEDILESIFKVIQASRNGEFEKIDSIHLHKFFKWKIAYLYSSEKLAPFFEKGLLLFAAELLGGNYNKKTKISVLQRFIMKNRNKNQTIYEYSNEIYVKYAVLYEKRIKYFIVGSKYGGQHSRDVFPKMKKKGIICIGFAPERDLTFLTYQTERLINAALRKLLINDDYAKSAKMALNQFLILKPGDMIAIKSSGRPRNGKLHLEIRAYATVVERDDKVYWYDDSLGHCVNVEFIDTNIKKTFEYNYSHTIHQVTDIERIRKIFESYESNDINEVRKKLKMRRRRPAGAKKTGKEKRRGGKPYVADMKHNRIQEEFEKYLVKQHGRENVLKEKDFIDITLTLKNKKILYEVKPYYWAEDCIRAGMGQIFTYSFFQPSKPKIELAIVGPNKPDVEETKIIKYLKNRMSIKFDYIAFSDY